MYEKQLEKVKTSFYSILYYPSLYLVCEKLLKKPLTKPYFIICLYRLVWQPANIHKLLSIANFLLIHTSYLLPFFGELCIFYSTENTWYLSISSATVESSSKKEGWKINFILFCCFIHCSSSSFSPKKVSIYKNGQVEVKTFHVKNPHLNFYSQKSSCNCIFFFKGWIEFSPHLIQCPCIKCWLLDLMWQLYETLKSTSFGIGWILNWKIGTKCGFYTNFIFILKWMAEKMTENERMRDDKSFSILNFNSSIH